MIATHLTDDKKAFIAHYSLLACKFFLIIFPVAIGVERAPADITMNLCSAAGLIYLASSGRWPKFDVIILALIAIATVPFIATIFSFKPMLSLDFAAGYTRFMLFGFVCYSVIGPNWRDNNDLMLFLSSLLISLIFFGFMLYQKYVVGAFRLYGTYGSDDLLAGAFVYSVALGTLMLLAFRQKHWIYESMFVLLLFFVGWTCFLSGERMSGLLCLTTIISVITVKFILNRQYLILGLALLILATTALILLIFEPAMFQRYTIDLLSSSPLKLGLFPSPEVQPAHPFSFIDPMSPYGSNWSKGLEMFWDSPVIGQGPGMYDLMVCDLRMFPGSDLAHCNTHPHSFLISWLGETGIIGAVIFAASFSSIIFTGLKCGWGKNSIIGASILGLSLYMMIWFFPLRSNNEWWSQRGNLFLWFPLGLLLLKMGQDRLDSKLRRST